ncbi:MAG: uracil-DNA glycosylase [Paracoccaceae bacterium]|jgi:uracil-DNA glycosylase
MDLSRLGDWADLAFFQTDLPAIEQKLSLANDPVYPAPDRIFAALERTQLADTRVLILGQDPYHTPGKADGLAFSIPQNFGGRLDSLGNILKELQTDLDQTRNQTELSDWGVLLLNTALSVPQGKASAHKSIGWRSLIDEILDRLDAAPRALVLWGNHAQAFGKRLQNPNHLRIETAHPSPLSVHRGFFSSKPFSTINSWLQGRGQAPIDWAGQETT